ncbi:hypothetical protein NITGR_430018 [Nitrospina gracilis 3/211]|uniref:Uncharacterized protein n=1 Tax=Nitrospina gracilis (strain 3/211) TaxID=1266370 RepID=M1YK46_NITG3|nr:hypothetical protein NITGR_430018 [Nitrospina gracilis 3/211]
MVSHMLRKPAHNNCNYQNHTIHLHHSNL